MMKNNFLIISTISFLWILLANNIYAHGFGERYDLPIPLTFFLIGAGLTIIFSFFLLLLFYKQNKKTDEFKSPVIINQSTLNNLSFKFIKSFIKISSVFIFLLIILTGYLGSNNPIENFSAPMIWIIWWVGFGIITPIIGDKIVGIVTAGIGVSVHTVDCEILSSYADSPERWLDISWETGSSIKQISTARISVTLTNQPGSLGKVTTIIAKNNGNISNINFSTRKTDFFEIIIDIEVRDANHLNNIIAALRLVSEVSSLVRVKG